MGDIKKLVVERFSHYIKQVMFFYPQLGQVPTPELEAPSAD
jgi:hypothetical protein